MKRRRLLWEMLRGKFSFERSVRALAERASSDDTAFLISDPQSQARLDEAIHLMRGALHWLTPRRLWELWLLPGVAFTIAVFALSSALANEKWPAPVISLMLGAPAASFLASFVLNRSRLSAERRAGSLAILLGVLRRLPDKTAMESCLMLLGTNRGKLADLSPSDAVMILAELPPRLRRCHADDLLALRPELVETLERIAAGDRWAHAHSTVRTAACVALTERLERQKEIGRRALVADAIARPVRDPQLHEAMTLLATSARLSPPPPIPPAPLPRRVR